MLRAKSGEERSSDYRPSQFHGLRWYFSPTMCSSSIPDLKFILVSYVGERPWWPIQSPNNGREKKVEAKSRGRQDQVH